MSLLGLVSESADTRLTGLFSESGECVREHHIHSLFDDYYMSNYHD